MSKLASFFRLLPCLALLVGAPSFGQLSTVVLNHLNSAETQRGHLFHAGYLWTTLSATNDGLDIEHYNVGVYDPSGMHYASFTLPHSAQYIIPFGEDQVLISGRRQPPWTTHYTLAKLTASGVQLTHRQLSTKVQADRFTGSPKRAFFSDPGEGRLYQFSGTRFKALKHTIHSPGEMLFDGRYIFVVERNHFKWGDENIVRIDMNTNQAVRIFPENNRKHFSMLTEIKNSPWIVAAETMAGKVVFINRHTNEIRTELEGFDFPQTVNQLGSCLLVGTSHSKQVHFIGLDSLTTLATWDLLSAFNLSSVAMGLTVDPVSRALSLRTIQSEYGAEHSVITITTESNNTMFDRCLNPAIASL